MKLKMVFQKLLWALQRSHRWPALRRKTLKACGQCAACGSTRHLVVHHIKPFHLYPELELDPKNLIVLCETPGVNCHLRIGHGREWTLWNPSVVRDAALVRNHPSMRTTVCISARSAAFNARPASD